MDFLFVVLLSFLVGLLIFVAFSFGLFILGLIVATAIVMATILFGQEMWRRWRFVNDATRNESGSQVIEVEYRNITDEEKQ